MKNQEKASISIMKVICVSIILILISGISVMAVSTKVKDIKIVLKNGYELTVLTRKSTISDILDENNIVLEENQKTIPELTEEAKAGDIIKIVDKSYTEVQIATISEEGVKTTLEELLNSYAPITEKIITEQVEIPYQTITKNATETSTDTTSKILQQGKNGLKNVVYKVKYQNNIEIEKIQLSETIIKEPVNKIIQINKNVTSRSSTTTRATNSAAESSGEITQVYKVTAYCPCSKCCGKTNGLTAMGTKATAGRTVAASSKFAYGTKLNINGHIYTVEDRGGSIKGDKIDIYVNSHAEALAWGVRYLPVTVIK